MQRLPLRVLAQNKVHHLYFLKMISIQLLDNVSNIFKVFRHILDIRGRIYQIPGLCRGCIRIFKDSPGLCRGYTRILEDGFSRYRPLYRIYQDIRGWILQIPALQRIYQDIRGWIPQIPAFVEDIPGYQRADSPDTGLCRG